MRSFRTTDPYQTSIRNYGVNKPMKRAPVDAVDSEIEIAVAKQVALGKELAEHFTPQGMSEMTALCVKIAELQFERDRIIRETFYGKTAATR